ncbi:MAG: nuclear transport factor 2 family protein [Bryobacteraceae bacterium]|nr:nuclear transport factor 2 family protein [Bryobacteraceae bacterium]MCX7604972.1 nuclear transport factor 2 family protein [Bryobacteraceae bacterium]
MKQILAVLLLCAAGAWGADETRAVEEAERGWARGVTANDFALLEKVLAPDLVYTHSNGLVDSRDSYIESLRSGRSRYLKVDYSELKVRHITPDVALTHCRALVVTLQQGKETPMNLALLHVFVKRGGQWQMVAHQSARLPQ